jgi:hypothetical protein
MQYVTGWRRFPIPEQFYWLCEGDSTSITSVGGKRTEYGAGGDGGGGNLLGIAISSDGYEKREQQVMVFDFQFSPSYAVHEGASGSRPM